MVIRKGLVTETGMYVKPGILSTRIILLLFLLRLLSTRIGLYVSDLTFKPL